MALADKLQQLEQQVEEKVQGTRMAAMDIINHAKSTAVNFVESTTNNLNPATHAGRRPWALVGGAIAIGFIAGWIDQRRKASGGVYPYYPPKTRAADVMPPEPGRPPAEGVYPYYPEGSAASANPDEGNGHRRGRIAKLLGSSQAMEQVSSLWDDMARQVVQERDRLVEAVVQAGRTFLQDVIHLAAQSAIDAVARRPADRSVPQHRAPV